MNHPTRSERYFVDLFEAATLQGAVERAARRERGQLHDEVTTLPVDVFGLARDRRIQVMEDLAGTGCEEGLLIPHKDGYRVRLRETSTDTRKRFSLAHELGHTLFYQDSGDGPRHQISVLNSAERSAEERVCNLFAGALLMPSKQIHQELTEVPESSPSVLLIRLENVARRFRVSLRALLERLRSIELDVPNYLLICLSCRPNPATHKDITLRVDACVNLGPGRTLCIWRNRSAERAGLKNACSLYKKWEQAKPANKIPGHFNLDTDSEIVTRDTKIPDIVEDVFLSRLVQGRWANEATRTISASRLYAWTGNEGHGAYVISALTAAVSGKVELINTATASRL